MSRQYITIGLYKLAKPNEFNQEHLEVEVFYSLGGMNYFSGRVEPRGYWVSVQPMTKTRMCSSFVGFTGVKGLIREAHRFSQKTLEEVSKDPFIKEVLNEFVEKHDLILEGPAEIH